MENEKTLSTDEAARVLSIHPNTVRSLIRQEKIPGVKVGRQWRILESTLKEFLNQPHATPVA